ncbi:hypothetical protein JCM14076_26590 [Methylosoma difficile]
MFNSTKNPPAKSAVISQFDNSCHTLVLSQVNGSHTNAEALWQKNWVAYPEICEKHTKNNNYRLREALENNTASRYGFNDQLKRSRPQQFSFSDVLVWLPQAVIEREQKQNTGALNALTNNLTVLHNELCKGRLLDKRPARYAVLPSNKLLANELAFQFGTVIYVADANEQPECLLTAVLLDGQGGQYPFSPQVSYAVNKMQADNCVYAKQDNIFVIKPSEHLLANMAYSQWFADTCSHVQLHRSNGGWLAYVASGGSVTIVTSAVNEKEWLFEFSDASVIAHHGEVPRLQLRLQALTHVTDNATDFDPPPIMDAKSASVSHHRAWGRAVIPDVDKLGSYTTLIPENQLISPNTLIPNCGPLLVLESLALPRIDGSRRIKGLKRWLVWFDEDGNIVDGYDTRDRSLCAALSANADEAVAYFKLPKQDFAAINPAMPLPLGMQSVAVLASPVKDYHYMVKLLNPISFVLQEQGLYTLGRESAESVPEINLTLLNDPLGMEWATAENASSVLSNLSLSRNHLSLLLQDGRLLLTVQPNKQPVYVLDSERHLKATLQSKTQVSEGVVMADEYLLLGSFLLRFCL